MYMCPKKGEKEDKYRGKRKLKSPGVETKQRKNQDQIKRNTKNSKEITEIKEKKQV